MLETLAIVLFCRANLSAARARGRSAGAAVAYTIGLWLGLEALGPLIALAAAGAPTGSDRPAIFLLYFCALAFALGGGTASYFIAHRGRPLPQSAGGPPPSATPGGIVVVQARAGTNGLAVAALVLGVIGGSVLAIVFGHIARSQIRRTGQDGAGMALAGLILGYIWLGLTLALGIFLIVLPATFS
ncbi:MAG: DUF4190 domain-containing protein [Bifidobacteriaceae bacterium]|jgi:hypothetical protein|nr:DUF4190 domain-containing protein [Bifidobacteriaceae bacterium]